MPQRKVASNAVGAAAAATTFSTPLTGLSNAKRLSSRRLSRLVSGEVYTSEGNQGPSLVIFMSVYGQLASTGLGSG